MKKLRIAMFMSSNPNIAGGVQEHVLYLSNELRKRGHEVSIFGPRQKLNIYNKYKAMGEKINFSFPIGQTAAIHVLNEKNKPEKIFIKKKFDILHVHELYIPFAAWVVLEKSKVPVIGTFHSAWDAKSGLNILNAFIPMFKDKFSSLVDGAIFVSKITEKIWRPICNRKVVKCIIPNAADTTLCKPKKEINKIPNILFAARLVKGKGVMYLLKAIEMLKKRGRKFNVTIMGKGTEKSDAITFIKTHKLKNNVRYLGEIIGPKRFQFFTEADIFCAPYSNEAAPLAILEAISAGLPIVGFMNDSFRESLSLYPAHDLLVKKNDVALATALESLIMNKERIESIKKWCLSQRNNYSWATVAKQTENAYYQVLQNSE